MNSANESQSDDDGSPSEEQAMCPNCLLEIPPLAHFCERCGAPVSSIAVMDPMGTVYARGFAFQKAATRSTRPIMLIGMWLLFAPTALFMLGFGLYGLVTLLFHPQLQLGELFSVGLFLAFGWLFASILIRTTRNYRRLGRDPDSEADSDDGLWNETPSPPAGSSSEPGS